MMRYYPFLLLLLPLCLIPACSRKLMQNPQDIVGTYSRNSPIPCTGADIELSLLPDGRYAVHGLATWCPDEESGEQGIIHVGEIDFVASIVDSVLRFDDSDLDYNVEVKVMGDRLSVVEEGGEGYHGHNVTFDGIYLRSNGE